MFRATECRTCVKCRKHENVWHQYEGLRGHCRGGGGKGGGGGGGEGVKIAYHHVLGQIVTRERENIGKMA